MAVDGACWSCRKPIEVSLPVPRKEECPHCGVELRVCRQCGLYDNRAPNECRDAAAEPVREKERSNYCEFYRFQVGRPSEAPSKEALRAAAEALFKKKP